MPEQAQSPEDGSYSAGSFLGVGGEGAEIRSRSGSSGTGLLWAALLVGLVVTSLVAIGAIAIWRSSASPSRKPAAAATPRPPAAASRQLTYQMLQPGDCLRGSNLQPGGSNPWPEIVEAVPCSQRHLEEVFFAGNAWPYSRAFPGNKSVTNRGWAVCVRAFKAYDGISEARSSFQIEYVVPDHVSWSSGSRWVLCAAYEPGLSVNYSIKRKRL